MKQFSKALEHREVTLDIPPTLQLVHVDPVLLERVLVNILDNAIKYTTEGGRIASEGVQEGQRPDLAYQRRWSGHPSGSTQCSLRYFLPGARQGLAGRGNRLGFSICRGIIEAHGGRILAKDGPNRKGTTIEVVLPLTEAPSVPHSEADEQLNEEVGVS